MPRQPVARKGSAPSTSGGASGIKMVTALVRPEKLNVLKDALDKLNLVGGVTLTSVKGFGRQRGSTDDFAGREQDVRFVEKLRIDMAVPVEDLEKVLVLFQHLAYTGRSGDGKVFVTDVSTALRIRTGERGIAAL